MVLTLLGALGILLLNADRLEAHVKEEVEMNVFIKDSAKEVDIAKIQKRIDSEPATLRTKFISKEQAAKQHQEEMGQDFIETLGGINPLPHTIVVNLKADYMAPDSVAHLAQLISADKDVREVSYPADVISAVHENTREAGIVLLALSALLLLIAFVLINNTIRLAMYSKRFLIRSMQLVGAKRGFIQGPFLWQGIAQGLISGIIAMGILVGILHFGKGHLPPGTELMDRMMLLKLFGATVLVGILIAFFSTMFAVNKYIGMELDELY